MLKTFVVLLTILSVTSINPDRTSEFVGQRLPEMNALKCKYFEIVIESLFNVKSSHKRYHLVGFKIIWRSMCYFVFNHNSKRRGVGVNITTFSTCFT